MYTEMTDAELSRTISEAQTELDRRNNDRGRDMDNGITRARRMLGITE